MSRSPTAEAGEAKPVEPPRVAALAEVVPEPAAKEAAAKAAAAKEWVVE